MTRLLAFCLLLSLRPALADASLNRIYLGKSQILETAPPRQISLNAHVNTWQADPLGLTIAYVGSTWENGTLTQTVKLAGVRRGQTRAVLTTTFTTADFWNAERKAEQEMAVRDKMTPEQFAARAAEVSQTMTDPKNLEPAVRMSAPRISLQGWSGDGRFLLMQVLNEPVDRQDLMCVDTAADPPRLQAIVGPTDENALNFQLTEWSPKRTRIALTNFLQTVPGPDGHAITPGSLVALYDPARHRVYPVAVAEGLTCVGWVDENHLLLRRTAGKRVWISHDLTTGQQTEIPRPAIISYGSNTDEMPPTPAPTGLSLADEPHRVADKTGTATMESHALWVRRAGGPKTLSAFPVALTPGADSPQAGWLPGGKRVAFVSHGDLFVADLIVRPAIPREKLAAGETLSCPEERDLAVGNLKLIGLAITQYMQDNDENYPPGAGVEKTIDPYIKDPSIFAVGASRFVYKPPANRSLAAMAAPAATVIGTLDLRCATISLYADGHVRAKDKPGFE